MTGTFQSDTGGTSIPLLSENYYTVEQVQQIYGLTSANICHIVKVKHIGKVKVGRKNLLLRADVERVMAERNEQP